jgi:hypothetical protein
MKSLLYITDFLKKGGGGLIVQKLVYDTEHDHIKIHEFYVKHFSICCVCYAMTNFLFRF